MADPAATIESTPSRSTLVAPCREREVVIDNLLD
jgi:hypothetical protein